MRTIPAEYIQPCERKGTITEVPYEKKQFLLYTPAQKAEHILYLIHGGGGNERTFFRPAFVNMIDHMIEKGNMSPLYIVTPCFYDAGEQDKSPSSSGKAVLKFQKELRDQVIPLAEKEIGHTFEREERAISGFSMGGVTTWHVFMQSLDLFYWFLPLSGDCWALGEKGGGEKPEETAKAIADTVIRQGNPDYRLHAVTGSADIAFPNLDAQMQAMKAYPDVFGVKVQYDVLEGGVHDYETIYRYLFNVLPLCWHAEKKD